MTDNSIVFTTEDGEEVIFSVMEQTTLGGVNYLLVTEAGDTDDESFLILRENNQPEADKIAVFDIVEDEKELKLVAGIFNELLEDVDLEV
jgi:uncharacterized protein YrzB (UPF0473 family)